MTVTQAQRAIHCGFMSIGFVVLASRLASAASQDLLGDNTSLFSDGNHAAATLDLRPFVQMPSGFNNINSMTTRPGDNRLYVTTAEGTIFRVDDNGSGAHVATPWFNLASAMAAGGHPLYWDGTTGSQAGLQSVAFHPDFNNPGMPGYGKFYTSMEATRPANPSDPSYKYLGNTASGVYGTVPGDGLLAEWTYNFQTGQVDSNSYRELFRANMPLQDHPIKQARFDPYARPGDADYGLLYMTHGDSNPQDSPNNDPQDRGDLMGKMIRINPLQSGADRYTIPADNPFAGSSDTNTLKEIYAYGFRNPHTFSFNRDSQGNIRILVGDIGRSNVEEVDLVTPGSNYGWTKREGTFVHKQGTVFPPSANPNAGYVYGVSALPANEATIGVDSYGTRYTYPVAQYDHNGTNVQLGTDYTATSIATGFVISNGSDPALQNQLVFNNFAFNTGNAYHTDFTEMLNAVTQLDPNDPSRDSPSELTQATKYRLHLALDGDNNPNTPPTTSDDLNTLLGVFRNDARYGEGLFGEMYISTKDATKRSIYLVTNSVPLSGDYNKNHVVDAADYTVWRDSMGQSGYHLAADGNGDGVVDSLDREVWQSNFGKVWTATGGGSAAAVAEPATWALALVAAAILLWQRPRRQ